MAPPEDDSPLTLLEGLLSPETLDFLHTTAFHPHSPPLSIYVDTYGTSDRTSDELVEIINQNFDLRPGVIVRELNLDRPIYNQTAKNGHFGTNQTFTWEQPKQLKF
ncbi:hypothetical protein BN1708_018311, partial [Verticillium longisporum]